MSEYAGIPVEVHSFLKSFVVGQEDIKSSITVGSDYLHNYIKALTDSKGYAIEYIIITKSCAGCG